MSVICLAGRFPDGWEDVLLARVPRLVYGAADPKAGAVTTLYRLLDDPRLNHRVQITQGVLGDEAGAMLRAFFRARR